MRNVAIILSKELRSYFTSPVAYIFIIIFLLLTGAYFVTDLFVRNTATLGALYEVAPVILLFFAPAITMRLVSEEKKTGTFEILGTKSIETGEIIIGKFLAGWILVLFALIPTIIHLMSVSLLGNVDVGPVMGGYLGLVLLGGAFVAIGLLGSTFSESQIVAFIISFSITLVLFVLDRILIYLPIGLIPFVEYLSVNHHFSSLARGVLDTRDILYFVSLTITVLLLARIFAGRELGQSFFRFLSIGWKQQLGMFLLVFLLLMFLNLFAMQIFLRVDCTENKVYTFSETTKELIASLDDNFFINAYFSPDLPPPYHNHRRVVQELLDEYRALSGGKIHYRFTNPMSDSLTQESALAQGIKPVQVKVLRQDQFQNAKAYVGLSFSYEDKHGHLPLIHSLERIEYDVTSSMKRMLSRESRRVGLLTRTADSLRPDLPTFRQILEKQYDVVPVDVGGGRPVPEGIVALLVIAPRSPFTEAEKISLDQYLMAEGRIGFFMNAVIVDSALQTTMVLDVNLDDMFDHYGWIILPDLVADSRCVLRTIMESSTDVPVTTEIPDPFYPIAADFNPANSIVRNLAPVAFSYVSPIDTRLATIRGVTANIIVVSSMKARRVPADSLDVSIGATFGSDFFNEEKIPLAATFEGSFRSLYARNLDLLADELKMRKTDTLNIRTQSPSTRIAVVGDGDFLFDEHFYGEDNVALGANLVDWLMDDISLTSIRSRDITEKPLTEVSEDTRSLVKYFNFTMPPLLVILAGILRLVARAAHRNRHKLSSF